MTACCVDQQTTIQEQINVKSIIPVIAPHDEVYGNNACVQCFIGLWTRWRHLPGKFTFGAPQKGETQQLVNRVN